MSRGVVIMVDIRESLKQMSSSSLINLNFMISSELVSRLLAESIVIKDKKRKE